MSVRRTRMPAGTPGTNGSNGAAGAPGAVVQLADTTINPAATTFTFSSISGSYNHLKLILLLRAEDNAARQAILRFNNDSGNNYGWLNTSPGTGAGATSSINLGSIDNAADASGDFAAGEIIIPSYASTGVNKSLNGFLGSADHGTAGFNILSLVSGAWNNTAAVTRIDIICSTGNFLAQSRASLYGIL